jgi:hypothetical protein
MSACLEDKYVFGYREPAYHYTSEPYQFSPEITEIVAQGWGWSPWAIKSLAISLRHAQSYGDTWQRGHLRGYVSEHDNLNVKFVFFSIYKADICGKNNEFWQQASVSDALRYLGRYRIYNPACTPANYTDFYIPSRKQPIRFKKITQRNLSLDIIRV